jgi:ribosomal protein L32
MIVPAARIRLDLDLDTPDVGTALVHILRRMAEDMAPWVTCAACGCLCRPHEHCPSCQPDTYTAKENQP